MITNKFPNEPLDANGKVFGEAFSNEGRVSIVGRINFPREADFVITIDGRLILGAKHATLAKNADVLAAGTLKLSGRGDIRQIDNLSGHYRPSVEEALHAPELLNRLGFSTLNATIKFYEFTIATNGVVVTTNVAVNRQLK